MASAVAGGVLILSLWQRAKNPKSVITDDNIMFDNATVSTTVANNNSAPDISLVSSLELRRMINM